MTTHAHTDTHAPPHLRTHHTTPIMDCWICGRTNSRLCSQYINTYPCIRGSTNHPWSNPLTTHTQGILSQAAQVEPPEEYEAPRRQEEEERRPMTRAYARQQREREVCWCDACASFLRDDSFL